MKLVVMAALEDDLEAVHQLLREHRVTAWSELPVEGHGAGVPGWYGEIAPYRSAMVLAFLPAMAAADLMFAVQSCIGCKDARHPVRAWMIDIERAVVPHPKTPDDAGEERA